jgi:recombination DNA repair RAD52 pathway protein
VNTANPEREDPEVPLSTSQIDLLMQPPHPERLKNRDQGGKQLTYVEAYDIKATLIRLFGFGGFSSDVIDSRIIQIRDASNTAHVNRDGSPKTPQVLAQATVRLTIYGMGPDGQDVTYSESAVGANSAFDVGDAADNAIKTAASDALKRCAINLGSQFGLGLYRDGFRGEIVGHLFEPSQAEQYREVQASRAEAAQKAQEAAQAAADRATGKDKAEAPA